MFVLQVVQKPRAALLLVESWQKLPEALLSMFCTNLFSMGGFLCNKKLLMQEASRPSVKSFLLDGKDPRIMESDEQVSHVQSAAPISTNCYVGVSENRSTPKWQEGTMIINKRI